MKHELEKLLTLVVPTYNMEKYLARCLKSVTDENVPSSLEVIVVNDGSKDHSIDVIRQFEALRPDIIKVVDKANGHYGSCVNVGLELATGKYFRMLDADDWVNTDALIDLLERLKTCDVDLVVTLRTEHRMQNDGSFIVEPFAFDTVKHNHIYDARTFDIESHALRREFNMHSMSYKTSILRQIGLKHIEGVCYTDLQYCFLPIDRIKDLIVYDVYLYQYFIGRDDQSTSPVSLARNFSHINQVLHSLFEYYKNSKHTNAIVVRNQYYFLFEAAFIFSMSLRMQKTLSTSAHKLALDNYLDVLAFGVPNKILRKRLFRLWKKTKAKWALNLSLSFYHLVHFHRFKKMGL